MSFFCGPMRLRTKKKRGEDESLLSSDLDSSSTPVRIPNDPASQMTVLNDFIASLKDELSVSKGETVSILDVDRKWAFVSASSGRGFVPLSCLGPFPARQRSTSTVAPSLVPQLDGVRTGSVSVFKKDPCGRYVTLYNFTAQDEDDTSVLCGECVVSLNEDDPEWAWVRKSNGDEGFVPRSYLYSDNVSSNEVSVSAGGSTLASDADLHELQLCGTELMSLYDYQGRIAEDLSVLRGDLLYADTTNQTHDEWLWAYCPRTQTCGFIPKDYARPPALE